MIICKGNKIGIPYRMVCVFGVMAIALFIAGCNSGRGSSLKRHDLFPIPLGTLPGELDWFYRDGFRMAGTADIQSLDGLIFVSGGETGKVMVFNSYGDLITFVYDPERNPAPASFDEEKNDTIFPWPFQNPRYIAVYGDGFLVEDGVENERRTEDSDTGIVYDRVVLRFGRKGNYIGHLGREGFGGSPFPHITTVDVREDGGIVVTCRVPGAWMNYWYDEEGYPTATVRIREDQLPGLDTGNVALYTIKPDPVDWTLYIRIDVYPDVQKGERPEPRLYTLDLATLLYSEPLILPYVDGDPSVGIPAIPPDYLGTTVAGRHLTLTAEGSSQYRMMLIDKAGRVVQNRRLSVDPDAVIYRRFGMQNDGLLTGIFFTQQEASVAVWRIDKLIDKNG